jgi:hypothetical protein
MKGGEGSTSEGVGEKSFVKEQMREEKKSIGDG